jgi:hypothetical protein
MSCKPAQPPRVINASGLAKNGVLLPDEAIACERCLRESVATPDLAIVKDLIRFYAYTSRGKITDKPTADSINKPEAGRKL